MLSPPVMVLNTQPRLGEPRSNRIETGVIVGGGGGGVDSNRCMLHQGNPPPPCARHSRSVSVNTHDAHPNECHHVCATALGLAVSCCCTGATDVSPPVIKTLEPLDETRPAASHTPVTKPQKRSPPHNPPQKPTHLSTASITHPMHGAAPAVMHTGRPGEAVQPAVLGEGGSCVLDPESCRFQVSSVWCLVQDFSVLGCRGQPIYDELQCFYFRVENVGNPNILDSGRSTPRDNKREARKMSDMTRKRSEHGQNGSTTFKISETPLRGELEVNVRSAKKDGRQTNKRMNTRIKY